MAMCLETFREAFREAFIERLERRLERRLETFREAFREAFRETFRGANIGGANIEREYSVSVAHVLGTSDSANTVWLMLGAHRKQHMRIKHYQEYDPHTEHLVLVMLYKHVHLSMCPRQ